METEELIACIIGIISIILIIPRLAEDNKKTKALKKDKIKIKDFNKKQKQLPLYKTLTMVQIFGLLLIPAAPFLLPYGSIAEALGTAIGLYVILLLITASVKSSLSVNDEQLMTKYNLFYDKEKQLYYGKSITGDNVSFRAVAQFGKRTKHTIEPSFITYYYTLELKDNINLEKILNDNNFITQLNEFKDDFLSVPFITMSENHLILITEAKSYEAFSDASFVTMLFYKVYENSEKIAKLVLDQNDNL